MKGMSFLLAAGLLAGCAAVATAQQAEQPAPAARAPGMPQPVTLAQRPGATGGEALYIEYCAMCHAPNGMGTGLLGRTRPVALLEERDNLTAPFVVLATRGLARGPPGERGRRSAGRLQDPPHLDPGRGAVGGFPGGSRARPR